MPSKDKNGKTVTGQDIFQQENDTASKSDLPTMDTANRHQEVKRGNRNVTAEGETSRSVNIREEFTGHGSPDNSRERGAAIRGIVET